MLIFDSLMLQCNLGLYIFYNCKVFDWLVAVQVQTMNRITHRCIHRICVHVPDKQIIKFVYYMYLYM